MKCERCGLCCMDCGDLAGGKLTDSGRCSGLFFEGSKAVCRIQREWGYEAKPNVCKAYPFADIDDGKCHRGLASD